MVINMLHVLIIRRIMFIGYESSVKIYDTTSERGKRISPDYIATILNQQWRRDTLAAMARADGEPEEKRDAAICEFLGTLRELVDRWIDSGKDEKDRSVEEPWKRDVHSESASYPNTIATTLIAYWQRNPPRITIERDGRSSIVAHTFAGRSNAVRRARDLAIFKFVILLDSPERERLCRCDECRAYFVRARAPKKDTPIFRGTFCPECKGKGSVKRMNGTRQNRTKQMVDLAAGFWPRWKPAAQYGKRSKWVAEMMNKRLGTTRTLVTGKWVTQHEQEIKDAAERRK
jgi:hypothetical protein